MEEMGDICVRHITLDVSVFPTAQMQAEEKCCVSCEKIHASLPGNLKTLLPMTESVSANH